jgi:glucokinase
MVVSTGVGGGIVLGGTLVHGAFANAGHIGHVVVVPGGRACGCGAAGCLEAEASGTSIAAITGAPAAAADRAMRVRTGTLVGATLAATAAVLDLPLAVVSGSVALGFGEVFFDAAQAEIDRQARPGECWELRVVPGGLGADGPLVGAAALGFSAGSER